MNLWPFNCLYPLRDPDRPKICRALKPGGQVIVVDFWKIPGVSTPWVMGHVRAGQSQVVQEIESVGFRLVDDSDLLKTNYFLRFESEGRR